MTGTGESFSSHPGTGFSGPLALIHRNNCSNPTPMRAAARFAMPEKPWQEGVETGQKGTANCPYKTGSDYAWAWSSGYVEGRANAKRAT